jgi:hypothetical protein
MSEDRHPGINMHKLPIGGGFIGILFAIGSAVIFILGFPTLWYFVAFSAGLGVAIALLIQFLHQRTTDRRKPLSILSCEEKPLPPAQERAKKNGNLIHAVPTAVTI